MIIFFDFDGVLVDTLDITVQISRDLNPTIGREEIRWIQEGNVFERLDELERTTSFRRAPDFDDRYAPLLLETPLCEGIREVVEMLAPSHHLTIVSSSHSDAIQDFLKKQNLSIHFREILGKNHHFSKVYKIKDYLFRSGQAASNAIFVTDTSGDLHEAHALGVPTIGVTWGYHEEERLLKGNPHRLARTPQEIISHIQDLNHG